MDPAQCHPKGAQNLFAYRTEYPRHFNIGMFQKEKNRRHHSAPKSGMQFPVFHVNCWTRYRVRTVKYEVYFTESRHRAAYVFYEGLLMKHRGRTVKYLSNSMLALSGASFAPPGPLFEHHRPQVGSKTPPRRSASGRRDKK